jgi:glutaredoxin
MPDIFVGLVTLSAKLGADIMLHEYTKQPYHLGEEETESIKSVKEVVTKPVIIIDDGEYTPFKEGE